MSQKSYVTQNQLLLDRLIDYYQSSGLLDKMLSIITGTSPISLRIVDWFATNYSKKKLDSVYGGASPV